MQSVIRSVVVNGGPGRSPDAERDPVSCGVMVAPAGVLMQSVIRSVVVNGGPGRSPTCDLRVRSAPLYASELRGQCIQCIVRVA